MCGGDLSSAGSGFLLSFFFSFGLCWLLFICNLHLNEIAFMAETKVAFQAQTENELSHVCVCVCVCREKERERERERVCERECVCGRERVCVCVCERECE